MEEIGEIEKNRKNELMIEGFRQAGREYIFFQDLSLKYLAFYIATLSIITAAFITISTAKFDGVPSSTKNFLQGDFLSLSGLFLIFIGAIIGFILLRCHDKAIISIKSLAFARMIIAKDTDYSKFKKYFYHALSVPRHYKLLSPTQGIILFIFAINSIVISNVFGFEEKGVEGLIRLFDLEPRYAPFIIIACLTFIQYLAVYNYMVNKDKVEVKLKFEEPVEEIELEYDVPRAITNSSFGHIITMVMFYLIGLTEKDIIFFRRRKSRRFKVKDDELKLKLMTGHYKIKAPGTKRKDLIIFGDIYEEFTEKIKFQPGAAKLCEKVKDKPVRNYEFFSRLIKRGGKAINIIIRFAFYLFLFWLPTKWGLFKGSKIYWSVMILILICCLCTFVEFFREIRKRKSKSFRQTINP